MRVLADPAKHRGEKFELDTVLLLTFAFLWELLKSKWMWLLAIAMMPFALLSSLATRYLPLALLLFVPGLMSFWLFARLYVRKLENKDAYVEQGAKATWKAIQGDWSGTMDQAIDAVKPGWFSMLFYNLSWILMHPAVAALVALVAMMGIGVVAGVLS